MLAERLHAEARFGSKRILIRDSKLPLCDCTIRNRGKCCALAELGRRSRWQIIWQKGKSASKMLENQ